MPLQNILILIEQIAYLVNAGIVPIFFIDSFFPTRSFLLFYSISFLGFVLESMPVEILNSCQ